MGSQGCVAIGAPRTSVMMPVVPLALTFEAFCCTIDAKGSTLEQGA